MSHICDIIYFQTKETNKVTVPLHYEISNSVGKLMQTEEYKNLSRKHGDLSGQLADELKRIVNADHARDLATYEATVSEQALDRLRDKLSRQSKAADAVRAVDVLRQLDIRDNFAIQPKAYSFPDHLQKIVESPSFAKVAHSGGYLPQHDAVRNMLTSELKAVVAAHADAHLASYEKKAGERALNDLATKLDEKSRAA
jgi:hypothetical protein